MLGRVDRRSKPILASDNLNTSHHGAYPGYEAATVDDDRRVADPYDYGDPTWYETSEFERLERWGKPSPDYEPAVYESTGNGAASGRDEPMWLDGNVDEIRLSRRDWIEGLRPAHPTSIAARLARLGSMLGITALVGLGVVLLSVTQAGRTFEVASNPDVDDDSLAIDTGSQADTGSWVDEIPLLNRVRLSAAPITDSDEQSVETTTTTAWVEPPIEPVAEWADAGHGVMVPDLLLRIRFCESTNNYLASHVVSSARGAYQFLAGSWDWYGHAARYGVPSADQATPAQQDEAAVMTLEKSGARPWAASRACWDSPDIDSRYATAKPPATATTTTSSTVPESTTTASESSETSAATETTAQSETTTSTTTEQTTTVAIESTTTSQETSESQPDESTSSSTESTTSDGG